MQHKEPIKTLVKIAAQWKESEKKVKKSQTWMQFGGMTSQNP
jgi:hypothetical protein